MHSVQHVMQTQNLVTASPDTSVYDTAFLMTRRGVGAVSIIDRDRLVGIFSERDLMTRVLVAGLDPRTTPLSSVMTRDVITAELHDRTTSCMQKMKAGSCRHLPVLSGGRVIAMLSMRDLMRDEIEEQSDEIRHLRAYLHQERPH